MRDSRYPDQGIDRQEYSLIHSDVEGSDLPFKTSRMSKPTRNDNLWIQGSSQGLTAPSRNA